LLHATVVHNRCGEIAVNRRHNTLHTCGIVSYNWLDIMPEENSPVIAKLEPMHMRPPLPNAQKCRCICFVVSSSASLSSQRVWSQVPASGYTLSSI
jgi:hypothetical protein